MKRQNTIRIAGQRQGADTRRTARWALAALLFLLSLEMAWGGMLFSGLVLPIVFYLVPTSATLLLAAALVLIGGIILRFLVVYTDERVLLPGEEQFLRWLPDGDETFLSTWEE